MWIKRILALVPVILLSACQDVSSSKQGASVAYDLDTGITTITCFGSETFEPVEGITQVLLDDMRDIADKSCAGWASGHKFRLKSNISIGSAVAEEAEVKFECDRSDKISADFNKELSSLCRAAFKRFGLQQKSEVKNAH